MRRRFHHVTFYGFVLCFASTTVATIYHYAPGLVAPNALTSLPVALGTIGGLGLVVGPAGLLWLEGQRDAEPSDSGQRPMQRSFIAMLVLVSATGLALLALRDTALMGPLLALHLGSVLAFFVALPYGKFVHGISARRHCSNSCARATRRTPLASPSPETPGSSRTAVAEWADKPHPARLLGRLIGNRLASFTVTNPVAREMCSVNSQSELWLLSNELGPDVPVRSRHGDLLARSTLPKRPCRRGPRSPDSTGQGYT